MANMMNRALFPASESTLSISDSIELIQIMLDNHSQVTDLALVGFFSFAKELNEEINDKSESPWTKKMDEAVSMLVVVEAIIKQEMNDERRMRYFTTMLALSYVITKSSSLDHFRRNSKEIVCSSSVPFVLTEKEASILTIFTSAIFLFWLSYDQLDIEDTSGSLIKSILERAALSMNEKHELAFCWMTLVTRLKFDKSYKTELMADKLTAIKTLDDDSISTEEISSIVDVTFGTF